MHSNVDSSTIYSSQDIEATYVSINAEWIKMSCVCDVYNTHLFYTC